MAAIDLATICGQVLCPYLLLEGGRICLGAEKIDPFAKGAVITPITVTRHIIHSLMHNLQFDYEESTL